MPAQYYRQLHSSFGGGSAAQGGIDGEADSVLLRRCSIRTRRSIRNRHSIGSRSCSGR
jgi:hypothetical protein